MRLPIQRLFQMRRWLFRRLRLRTRGVKVMLFNGRGELLLVRNSYGNRDAWLLPGGGIRPFEAPAKAAARELREETGLVAGKLLLRSTHHSEAEGKRDTIHLFTATSDGAPKADAVEVEEARFFPIDALPDTTSPATRRRIEEYRGEREIGTGW